MLSILFFYSNTVLADPEKSPEKSIEDLLALVKSQGLSHVLKREIPKIKDQEVLFQFALISVKQDPWETTQHIQKFKFQKENDLIEVLKILASREGRGVSICINNLTIRNENSRVEIAKIALSQDPQGTSSFIRNYKIKDQRALVAIAKIAAAQDGWELSNYIEFYNIQSEHDRIEIAKIAAHQSPWGTASQFKRFQIQDPKAIIEIAIIIATRGGEAATKYLSEYITEKAVLYEIAQIAIKNDIEALNHIEKFKLKSEQNTELHRIAFHYHAERYVQKVMGQVAPTLSDFKRLILISIVPDIADPQMVERAFGKVQRREVIVRLIRLSYKASDRLIPSDEIQDSTEFLFVALGMGPEQAKEARITLDKHVSENAQGELYDLLLDLDFNLVMPPLKYLPIEKELFTKKYFKSLLLFLTRLRDIAFILGNNDEAYLKIFWKIYLNRGLTVANINGFISELQEQFVREITKLFEGEVFGFTIEQLDTLKEKWGNLESIFTLIARFKSSPVWHRELRELTKVFRAVLSDQFFELKFKGDPKDPEDLEKAKQQLAILQEKDAFDEWTSLYSKVDAIESGGIYEIQALLEKLKEEIQDLKRQLQEVLHLGTSSIHGDLQKDILKSLSERKGSVEKAISDLQKKYPDRRIEVEAIETIIGELEKTEDTEEIKKDLVLMKSIADLLPMDHAFKDQLKKIAVSMLNQISAPSYEREQKSIVVITTFHDPKLLLTIGNLVPGVGSCLDYKTGIHIETLLGYVLDSDIQGLLAFNIEPENFNSLKEFQRVYKKIKADPSSVGVTLLPKNMEIVFKWEDEKDMHRVQTQRVEPFQRNVLKVGTAKRPLKVKNKPSIFREKSYRQFPNFEVLDAVDGMIKELIDDMHKKIGGVAAHVIAFSGSRNQSGVYSDASEPSGVQKNSYEIVIERTIEDRFEEIEITAKEEILDFLKSFDLPKEERAAMIEEITKDKAIYDAEQSIIHWQKLMLKVKHFWVEKEKRALREPRRPRR